jgi:hypothetical protein
MGRLRLRSNGLRAIMWRLSLVRRDNQKVVKERRLLSAVYGQRARQQADEPGVSVGDNPAGAAEWTQQPVDKYEFYANQGALGTNESSQRHGISPHVTERCLH